MGGRVISESFNSAAQLVHHGHGDDSSRNYTEHRTLRSGGDTDLIFRITSAPLNTLRHFIVKGDVWLSRFHEA